jgi:hypothetical protein
VREAIRSRIAQRAYALARRIAFSALAWRARQVMASAGKRLRGVTKLK